MDPFYPADEATVNIDVSSASQNVLVSNNPESRQVRVYNDGSQTVWIKFSTSSTAAATLANSVPVGPGVVEVYSVQYGPIYAAAIAAGSTGKVYFTKGIGI
jgi:hypothetical protein